MNKIKSVFFLIVVCFWGCQVIHTAVFTNNTNEYCTLQLVFNKEKNTTNQKKVWDDSIRLSDKAKLRPNDIVAYKLQLKFNQIDSNKYEIRIPPYSSVFLGKLEKLNELDSAYISTSGREHAYSSKIFRKLAKMSLFTSSPAIVFVYSK